MKKRLFVVLVISAGLMYLTSCKKDEKPKGEDLTAEFPTDQNVAADKAKVEDNAQLAVAELNTFTDEKGIEAISSFADFMSDAGFMSSSAESAKSNLVFYTVNKLNDASVKTNPREVFKSINTVLGDEPQSFKEVWDSIKGIYTWNSGTKKWEHTESTTVAEFHFPSTKTGTSNNAVFTISSYKGVVVTTSPIPDYTGDLPTELKANLKVDGTEYFAYSFAAAYTNEGIPTSVVTSVAFRSFVFTFEFSNSTSNISVNYKFTNGTKTIFDIGGAVNGNFSKQNLENADNLDVQDVLYNANAHFQLFNVKIAGMVDVVKIADASDKIYANDNDYNFDRAKADSLMAIEINKNAKLIAFFVDTKQKIANIEAYSVVDKQSNYIVYYIDYRMIFADGSPSNADNYFGTGFSGLVTDINALLAELNTKFGANFEPIDY